MKLRKLLCIFAILSFLLSALTACAGSSGVNTDTTGSDAAKTEETVPTESKAPDQPQSVEPPDGSGNPGEMPQPPDGSWNPGEMPQPPDGNGNPGEMPQPPAGNGNPGEMPQPPDGNGNPGEMPQPPDGNGNPGNPPEGGPGGMPPGNPPDGGPGGQGGMPPGGLGGGSADIDYTGAVEIRSAETQEGKTYASTTVDESALLISTSDEVSITNPTVTKTGSSNGGDNCNFYGLNAAVLAKDGAKVSITGGSISSDADGANSAFCYGGNGGRNGAEGDGTTLTIRDTKIRTSGSGSGGIMTTGGGITYAYDLDVETSGQSSAPIRTDRGGGQVYVDGGTYTSNGLGSPAIYSTAEIHVANAKLISKLSEGAVIEGLNSIELTDCEMTANNTKRNSNATFLDSVMLYQSMSGDAANGTSHFTMTGGSLTSKSGHVFHVTNTNAVITLQNVKLVNEDKENILLSVCDDGWSGGSNRAELKAIAQTLEGAVKVGSNSTLTLELTEGSSFEGTIDGSITNAAGKTVSTETGTVSVTLDADSTWTLTGDSWVTEFHGSAANVVSNGHTLYVNGVALTGTN